MRELGPFLDRFVVPLVTGGLLHVGAAIDAPTGSRWLDAVAAAGLDTAAVDGPRRALLAGLVVRPPHPSLDAHELALALALYNALALAHPDLERFTARASRRQRVLDTSLLWLARLPRAEGRAALLGRHALLARVFDLSRKDVHLSWWTGKAEFRGQRPPARLTTWSGLRNVRAQTSEVRFGELFAFDEGQKIVAALLEASPLTDFLAPDRGPPAFGFGRARVLLADVELARLVAQTWTAPARARTVLPAAAAAWERLLARSVEVAEVRAVTAFLVHLGVLVALDEQAGDASVEAEPGPASADLPHAAALFWALPSLCARVAPELAVPPGLEAEPALAKRWKALGARGAAALPGPEADKLASRLSAALGRAA